MAKSIYIHRGSKKYKFKLVWIINSFNKPYKKKKKFLEYLTKKGIENRPIISGNLLSTII